MTGMLETLASRARCPACGASPLAVGDGALLCGACDARWPVVSDDPPAVRLAGPAIAEIGAPFNVARPARRLAALRSWHGRREERFGHTLTVVPESQLEAIRGVIRALPPERRRVLDIGGGDGRWGHLVGGLADYTVSDVIAPEGLELRPGSAYVLADATDLPFAPGSFDVVLMIEVIEHLPEPGLALSEAARVLAPGGTLVLTTRQAWRTHGQPHDYFRYTRHGLEHLLRAAGFVPRRSIPLGGPATLVMTVAENNLAVLSRMLVRPLLAHPLWRLAMLLDRTVFRSSVEGPRPDVSGWLVVGDLEEG